MEGSRWQLEARMTNIPVHKHWPSLFQSKLVTSWTPFWISTGCVLGFRSACQSVQFFTGSTVVVRSQIRAVLSPEPDASRSILGFHAQMKTSDSWPRRKRARDAAIVVSSSSFVFSWDVCTGSRTLASSPMATPCKIKQVKFWFKILNLPENWKKNVSVRNRIFKIINKIQRRSPWLIDWLIDWCKFECFDSTFLLL